MSQPPPGSAPLAPGPGEPLRLVGQSAVAWNGVATTADGRVFVNYPRLAGEAGPRVAELLPDGTAAPYPDVAWNSWQPGRPAGRHFVRTHSLRIGPGPELWIVDTGTPRLGAPVVPAGPKLVIVSLLANEVRQLIPLDAFVLADSLLTTLRLTATHLFLTDAGNPALVVIDRRTGRGRRLLAHTPATTAPHPLGVAGHPLYGPDGQPLWLHTAQLELSPDAAWLYVQPATGPLHRVATTHLLNEALPAAHLAALAQPWAATAATGGTALDAAGNLYVTDLGAARVLRISPDRQAVAVVQDERLAWAAAPWLDEAGYLWLPVAQLYRTAPFPDGRPPSGFAGALYKVWVGATPARW